MGYIKSRSSKLREITCKIFLRAVSILSHTVFLPYQNGCVRNQKILHSHLNCFGDQKTTKCNKLVSQALCSRMLAAVLASCEQNLLGHMHAVISTLNSARLQSRSHMFFFTKYRIKSQASNLIFNPRYLEWTLVCLAINYSFQMKKDQRLHTLSVLNDEDKVHYAEARFFWEQPSWSEWGPLPWIQRQHKPPFT